MLWREEEEKLPRERSPLFVSCSNLWKQKAGEEWSTRASWGPVPRRRQHREGGLAMPFSASCHRVPVPGCRLRAAPPCQPHLGTDRETTQI